MSATRESTGRAEAGEDPATSGGGGAGETAAADALRRRVILTAIAIAVFSLYVASNQLMARGWGRPAVTLPTALDAAIPFHPPAEVIYLSVYLFLFLPVVGIRDLRVFERTAIAFYAYNLLGMAIFWAFPVKMIRAPHFPLDTLWAWGTAFNYAYDPPFNNFPSLHVANAIFAALVVRKVDPPVGNAAFVVALAISASTLLLKQHWLADVVAGAVLGWAGYRFIVLPAIPPGARREDLAYPRGGPIALAVIYAVVVGVFALLHANGVQPFPWPLPKDP